MSRTCEVCGKGTTHGSDGVHKHGGQWARRAPRTTRKWRPNLKEVRIDVGGRRQKVKMCTTCLRKKVKVEEKSQK